MSKTTGVVQEVDLLKQDYHVAAEWFKSSFCLMILPYMDFWLFLGSLQTIRYDYQRGILEHPESNLPVYGVK